MSGGKCAWKDQITLCATWGEVSIHPHQTPDLGLERRSELPAFIVPSLGLEDLEGAAFGIVEEGERGGRGLSAIGLVEGFSMPVHVARGVHVHTEAEGTRSCFLGCGFVPFLRRL